MLNQADQTPRELIPKISQLTDPQAVQPYLKYMFKYCPRCPLIIVERIRADENVTPELAAQWEATTKSVKVLRALAQYQEVRVRFNEGDAAAAELLWRRVVEQDPSLENHVSLANHFSYQSDAASFRATMLKCVETPRPGLENAQAATMIARSFIHEEGDAEAARPFALRAAASGSAWGLEIGAECLERLGEMSEAEALMRSKSLRYENSFLDWYVWCRRTGQGNLSAARQHAQRVIASMPAATRVTHPYVGMFADLEGRREEAASSFQNLLTALAAEKSGNPWLHLEAAVVLQELGKGAERDTLLQQLASRPDEPREAARLLADAFRRMLPGAGKPPSQRELEFLQGVSADGESQVLAAWLIGRFLVSLNRQEEGVSWLTVAASDPEFANLYAAQAAVQLKSLGRPVPTPRRSRHGEELGPIYKNLGLALSEFNEHRFSPHLMTGYDRMFDRILAEHPQIPLVAYLAASSSSRQPYNPVRQEHLYSSILQQVPEQPWMLCCRGKAREQNQDFSGALADYKAALERSPNHLVALNNLAWLYAGTGDAAIRNPAEALNLAQRVQTQANDRQSTFVPVLAAAHAVNGDYEQATKLLIPLLKQPEFTQTTIVQGLIEVFRAKKPYLRTVDPKLFQGVISFQ